MWTNSLQALSCLVAFAIVALASRQIGILLAQLKLPLITGFLLVGIIVGPYALKVISPKAINTLKFVDELSLAYIAFAAGSELIVRQLKPRFKAIRYNIYGQVLSIFTLGSLAFYFLSEFISFLKPMPPSHRAAVAIMAGAILVARSPSSAIAVANELRANGPFTKTVLGVTVIMDVVVITLFSISVSIAGTVLAGQRFDLRFLSIILMELFLSIGLGYLLGKAIQLVLSMHVHKNVKTVLILFAGYGIFVLSAAMRHLSHVHFDSEILFEPMLACMIGSFVAANFSPYRTELMKVLHDIGPIVYVAFFTLTGISLRLDVLTQCWAIALVLFGMRLAAIVVGAFTGGLLAGEPMKHNQISWMGYITQAGVGLGLAKQVSVEFPEWGAVFATIVIAVIVLNQIVGPPFLKWSLFIAKEAHPRTDHQAHDGVRDAIIFGLEGESLALARLLQFNNWEVKIATTQVQYARKMASDSDIEIHSIPDLSLATLSKLGVGHVDSIVAMLSDEENDIICEQVHENFGIRNLIVRLNHRTNFKRFHAMGALVVEPSTAIVNLLDQFVRSPSAARLLLGLEQGREIIEFELRNTELKGIAIRDLHLPLDLHILSIHRSGQIIVSVGFTRLEIGDWLTVVGSRTSLEQMMLLFGDNRDNTLVDMVDRAKSKQIASKALDKEIKAIIHDGDDKKRLGFDRLIEASSVLDLSASMTYDRFFNGVAETLSTDLNVSSEILFQLLMEREKESSTALRPDLAIPHIIIDGKNTFHILLARCKAGIYFSELAPKVQAVFILAGTRDRRDDHLYALSAIAEMVHMAHFQERWLRARNATTLRNIAKSRKHT